MARQRAEDRYRPRPQATRRIVVVKGDDARSYTIRPWLAGLGVLIGAALSVGYIGATAYLVFRDDLMTASFSRKADLQQAYEDRIASLRAEIDKIASRQLLDQVAYDEKVERLLAAQRSLGDRQKAVSALIEQARSSGLLGETAEAPAPQDERAATDALVTGSTTAYAAADLGPAAIERSFAALRGAGPDIPRREDGKLNLRVLADDIDRMSVQQAAAVHAIAAAADQRVDRVADIVEDLGVALKIPGVADGKTDRADEAVGGPYLPVNSPEALASAMAEASAAFEKLGQVKKAVGRLPVEPPLEGATVTSNFGSRSDPFLGSAAFHAGIDYRAPTGRDVAATAAGTVITAGRHGGYGNLVEIDHGNGLTTRYAHLSRIHVKLGERIRAGTVVGEVGSTGRSTGPHLHYETRVNGTAVNPMAYLSAGRELKKLLR